MRERISTLMAFGLFLLATGVVIPVEAQVPNAMTLEGQLFADAAATIPLLDTGTLTIQILDPNQTCVLYEQAQALDTRTSEGRFSVKVGAAVGASLRNPAPGLDVGNPMGLVYSNVNSTGIPGKYAGGASCTYVPQDGDSRFVRTIVATDTDHQTRTLAPDLDLQSYPSAVVAGSAETLKGFGPASFLQLATPGHADLTQGHLEDVFDRYANLMALLGGNSTSYMQSGVNTAALPRPAVLPTNATAATYEGQIWYDAASHMIRYSDGSTINSVGAAGSGLANLSVGNGLQSTAGSTISTGGQTISVNAGTGASQVVQLDGSGRLPAVDGSRLTNLDASMISTGTISLPVNATGNVQASGSVTASESRLGSLKLFSGANYVDLRAPATLASNYTLYWPASQPSSSTQILASTGTGALGWVDLGSGVVSNRASLPSGQIWVGDFLGTAQSRAATGDAQISNLGAIRVVGLQSRAVSSTAPVSGQVLGWNDTASLWQPVAMSTGTVQSVWAGPGLVGGPITTTGSLSVDTGTGALQILRQNAYAQIAQSAGSAAAPTYTFTSGADTGLYSPAAQSLAISTAGSTAMTIDPTGKVGIGTTSPNDVFEVSAGAARVTTAQSAGYQTALNLNNPHNSVTTPTTGINFMTGTTPVIYGRIAGGPTAANQGALVFSTRGTSPSTNLYERLRIDANGSVGIGSASPASTLDVAANVSNTPVLTLTNNWDNNTSYATLKLARYRSSALQPTADFGTGIDTYLEATVDGTNSLASQIQTNWETAPTMASMRNTYMSFGTRMADVYGEKVRITANGAVGIGTNVPAAGLDIATTGTAGSAMIVPRDSTTNRPTTPVNGMLRYNSTSNVMETFANGVWQTLASQASGGAGFLPLSGGTTSGAIVSANGSVGAPGISFANDPSTGLYSNGAGTLNLATAGTSRLNLLPNGNIGVGTTTPVNTFDVAGTMTTTGRAAIGVSSIDTQQMLLLYGTDANVYSPGSAGFASQTITNNATVTGTPSLLRFRVRNTSLGTQSSFIGGVSVASGTQAGLVLGGGSSEYMRIDSAGNVGIGTTAAGYSVAAGRTSLSVMGASDAGVVELMSRATDADQAVVGAQQFTDINSTNSDKRVAYVAGLLSGSTANNRGGALIFGTRANAGSTVTERMRINQDGTVGIGTTNPLAPLQVAGASGIMLDPGSPINFLNTNLNTSIRRASGAMEFRTNGAVTMVLTDAGYVGIGTATPSAPLHVTGNALVGGAMRTSWGAVGAPSISFSGNTTVGLWRPAADVLAVSTNSNERLRVDNVGNIGINTTTPALKLDVGGSAVFRGPTVGGVDGELFFDATTHTYRYYDAGAGAWQPLGSGTISYSGTLWNQSGSNINYATGNVGVRTASPVNSLDVAGSTAIGSFAGSVTGPSNGLIVSGRVGLGLSSPIGPLHVADANNLPFYFDTYFGSGSGATASLIGRRALGTPASPAAVSSGERLAMFGAAGSYGADFNPTTGAMIVRAEENFTTSAGGTSIRFETTPTGSMVRQERLQLAPSGDVYMALAGGKVGIGTNNPLAVFDVLTSTPSISTASFRAASGQTANIVQILASGGGILSAISPSGRFITANGVAGAPGFTFMSDTASGLYLPSAGVVALSTNGTERIRFDATGNVGIGTTTPTVPLEVNGNMKVGNITSTGNISGTFFGGQLYGGTGAASTLRLWSTSVTGTSDYIAFLTGSSNERVRIDTNGNVGVGTTNPITKLDVAGHIADSGPSATVGSCGTSPSLSGNDTRGTVTLGSGSPTSCVVTFAAAFGTSPYCTISAYGGDPGAGLRAWVTTSTTALTLNFSSAPTSGQMYTYHCIQ